jgi:hypothetical protein
MASKSLLFCESVLSAHRRGNGNKPFIFLALFPRHFSQGVMGRNSKKIEALLRTIKARWGVAEARRAEEQERNTDPILLKDAGSVAFSILASGLTPDKFREGLLWNNIISPSKGLVNSKMRQIGEFIVQMAHESCIDAIAKMPDGSVISFDGSWEHRRNSHRAIFTVFCGYNIIGFQIEDTRKATHHRVDKYSYIPQNLEVIALKHMIDRLKAIPQIVGYCHDNDARTRNVINDEKEWKIQEYVDQGHAVKSFLARLEKARFGEVISNCLIRWLRTLIQASSMSKAEKHEAWMNTSCHFSGNHKHCPVRHSPVQILIEPTNTELLDKLNKFLTKTCWIVEKCDSLFTTQMNESFHRGKLRYATKDGKWGFSWIPRMCCAILDRNRPNWKLDLHDFLCAKGLILPLSGLARLEFHAREVSRLARQDDCRTEQHREIAKEERQKIRAQVLQRAREARANGGKIGYKGKPVCRGG